MELAYTLAGPLANYMATTLDRDTHYADLEPQELGNFLDKFNNDSQVFGGGPECPAIMLGGLLSVGVCILTGDLNAFEYYEHVNITILYGIMRIGGMDSSERAAAKNAVSLCEQGGILDSSLDQMKPLARRSTPASQPRKPTGASAFAIEEDADFLASIGISSQVPENPETALQAAMADLESLIGLPGVKDEVKLLMSFLKIQQERRKHGLRESG